MPPEVAPALAQAIADAKDADPTDLGYVLEDHIPLDAVRRLATNETTSWTLSFDLPDLTVVLTSDGQIAVDGIHTERKA